MGVVSAGIAESIVDASLDPHTRQCDVLVRVARYGGTLVDLLDHLRLAT